MKEKHILYRLFLTFMKIGLFTFGGGYAMISIIENICVENLLAAFQGLDTQKLKAMNKAIMDEQAILGLSEMSRLIEKKCYGW